jgi:hypothetical protein
LYTTLSAKIPAERREDSSAAAHPSEAMPASQVQEFNKGEFHMTKFISVTIAFTLFAPIAFALAAQAAQIVA